MKTLILSILLLNSFAFAADLTGADVQKIVCTVKDRKDIGAMVVTANDDGTFSLFQLMTYNMAGNTQLTLGDKTVQANMIGQNIQNRSDSASHMILEAKFGKLFELTGYYGEKTLTISRVDGSATYAIHSKPHLISDINDPQGEHTNVYDLGCEAAQ